VDLQDMPAPFRATGGAEPEAKAKDAALQRFGLSRSFEDAPSPPAFSQQKSAGPKQIKTPMGIEK
jgi:hypothetical protein